MVSLDDNNVYFLINFFRSNRERLESIFAGSAPVVISANGLIQRNADCNYQFRQDSNFWYLTGIEEPDVLLVIDKNKEYLILPEFTNTQKIFNGYQTEENLSKCSGIDNIYDHTVGWRKLTNRLKKVKHVATIIAPPIRIDDVGLYTNPGKLLLQNKIRQINPDIKLLDLRSHFATMRVIKQPIEIKAITKAVDITIDGFRHIIGQDYSYEYQYDADLYRSFRMAGANNYAYLPVIGSGKNACVLHYSKCDSLCR